MKNIKIIDKNKFIRTISLLITILLFIICLITHDSYSRSEINYKIDYVIKGETLWQIAEREIKDNSYFENEDIQNVIIEIKKVNNMKTSNLSEGMEIKIPIYK